MSSKAKSTSFEDSLIDLENIVGKLESGELNLEQGLEAFEQGVELYRLCKGKLEAVEKKVIKLTAELKEEDL